MLKIENAPNHVIAVRLMDVLETNDITTLEKLFREKLASQDRLSILVDMTKWSDITADAIAEDFKFEFKMIGKLNRFDKMAVLANKQFITAFMGFMNPFFPTIDVKCFGPDEYDEALAFVSELPAKRPAIKSGIMLIDTGSPKILGFEIDGMMSRDDAERIVVPLQKAFEGDKQIDLFVRVKKYAGFDPSILAQKSIISTKLSAISHVRRYALVGAPEWMANVAGFVASMLPIDMKFFAANQESEAWTWLKS